MQTCVNIFHAHMKGRAPAQLGKAGGEPNHWTFLTGSAVATLPINRCCTALLALVLRHDLGHINGCMSSVTRIYVPTGTVPSVCMYSHNRLRLARLELSIITTSPPTAAQLHCMHVRFKKLLDDDEHNAGVEQQLKH